VITISKARKGRKPPAEAGKEAIVYLPETGFVKVGELKESIQRLA